MEPIGKTFVVNKKNAVTSYCAIVAMGYCCDNHFLNLLELLELILRLLQSIIELIYFTVELL